MFGGRWDAVAEDCFTSREGRLLFERVTPRPESDIAIILRWCRFVVCMKCEDTSQYVETMISFLNRSDDMF